MYIYTYANVYAYIYVHTYICAYIYAHIYAHILHNRYIDNARVITMCNEGPFAILLAQCLGYCRALAEREQGPAMNA